MTNKLPVRSNSVVEKQNKYINDSLFISALRKIFAMFDQGKTGFVETSKFVNILNTLGQTFDEDELKQRIEENDPNSKRVKQTLDEKMLILLFSEEGKVNFDSFSAIVLPFLEEDDDEAMHEELKEAFRLYDKEGIFSSKKMILFSQISALKSLSKSTALKAI